MHFSVWLGWMLWLILHMPLLAHAFAAYGRASICCNQSFGRPAHPADNATIPPTMAQFVSTSPPTEAVAAIASRYLPRYFAAAHRVKGTVSGQVTPLPFPSIRAADPGDSK